MYGGKYNIKEKKSTTTKTIFKYQLITQELSISIGIRTCLKESMELYTKSSNKQKKPRQLEFGQKSFCTICRKTKKAKKVSQKMCRSMSGFGKYSQSKYKNQNEYI